MITAVVIVAGLLLAGWIAVTFNRLVKLRNRTRAGWSDIDVQLQRRHDLIPRLAEAVRAYAGYESATLETVTELRTLSQRAAHLPDKAAVEDRVAAVAQKLIAVAEAYPDLKANQNFLSLQQELAHTENQLQYARRFYNGAVREFNTRLQSFPDVVVARGFAFKEREFFQAAEGASAPVTVEFD
ncbi:MAG: LemA family protein [Gammaproteobacteria bacterium]|nr:LemA family protein [Gammaproteobacteria bacterium]